MMGAEGHWNNPGQTLLPVSIMPSSPLSQAELRAECVRKHQPAPQLSLPREEGVGVVVPPDSTHVDWVTIPGATIDQLRYAWRLDYHREKRPQRVILSRGAMLPVLERA